MKTLTNSLIAAAALLVAAGSASAQAFKAEIPFPFRAGTVTMAPGTYRVTTTATPTVWLFNQNDRKSAMLLTLRSDAAKEWRTAGVAKVSFECIEGLCSLAKVWTGNGPDALELLRQRSHALESAGIKIVTFELKAE